MVQGNDSLEVISETQLDDSASFSCDDNIDAHVLNEEPVSYTHLTLPTKRIV